MFAGDTGFHSLEEVNIIVRGGNYGWKVKEGSQFTSWAEPEQKHSGYIDPIFEYPNTRSAVIGGYSIKPGSYVFGDYMGRIMNITEDKQGKWSLAQEVTLDGSRVKGFGQDFRGNIYVLTSKEAGPQGSTGAVSLVQVSS